MATTLIPPLTVCGLEGVLAPQIGAAAQPCDLAAARLYCAVGGHLSVFTSRGPSAVRAALGGDAIDLPAVTCGGALLYNLKKDTLVQARPISVQAGRELMQFVLNELPNAGLVGVTDRGQTCVLRASRQAQLLLQREGGTYQLLPPEEAGPSWCKLVVCGTQQELSWARAFLASREDLPVSVLRQDHTALELITAQVHPHETLRRLCSLVGCVQQEVTAIIADPMTTGWAGKAGRLLVMGDAPEPLRGLAARVLEPYSEGGAGLYLYELAAARQDQA